MSKSSFLKILFLIFSLMIPNLSPAYSYFDIQQKQAGNYADQYISKTSVLLYNDQLLEQVQRVGNKVVLGVAKVKGVDTNELNFTFRLINSPIINAAATSGGFIYIYSGLLDFVENEDELAWIIGHEMAHSIENHYIEKYKTELFYKDAVRNSAVILAWVGGALLGAYASVNAPSGFSPQGKADLYNLGLLGGKLSGGAVGGLLAVTIATCMFEGYSQGTELDADKLGAKFVEAAGYDPRALIGLVKRFQYMEDKKEHLRIKQNEEKHPVALSHFINAKPGFVERVKHLNALYPVSSDSH